MTLHHLYGLQGFDLGYQVINSGLQIGDDSRIFGNRKRNRGIRNSGSWSIRVGGGGGTSISPGASRAPELPAGVVATVLAVGSTQGGEGVGVGDILNIQVLEGSCTLGVDAGGRSPGGRSEGERAGGVSL